MGEIKRAIEIAGPCIHSGGYGVVRIEPYESGAHFRLGPDQEPELVSSRNYRAEFLTSAVVDKTGRIGLCPEHILSSCLLVGMSAFCVSRVSGPYEFPVGPSRSSYAELLLAHTEGPAGITIGKRIQSDIFVRADAEVQWSAASSDSPRLEVSWVMNGVQAVCGLERYPTEADIIAIGSARSFILSADVSRLQRRGRLLGAKDATRWLQPVDDTKLPVEVLDECAQHKLYDLLGDMCPLGGMPEGWLRVAQPGHAVNAGIRARLLQE
jgi:UDP-3-O-acyl-N-acetylglucosamine deacetylase